MVAIYDDCSVIWTEIVGGKGEHLTPLMRGMRTLASFSDEELRDLSATRGYPLDELEACRQIEAEYRKRPGKPS
jgi:hypothetical protein